MTTLPGLGLVEMSDWLLAHLLASLRLGAFLLAAPLFGARWVPLPVRILAAMVLALPVSAQMPVALPPETGAAVRLVLGELVLGLVPALVLSIVFAAAALAGDRIAATAGLGFAAQIDPASGAAAPVVAQALGLLLLGVFVAVDGHLVALRLVLDSYRLVPPGTLFDPGALAGAAALSGSAMFEIGARLMMPVVAVLLLVNLLIGVMTRSAPQLNLFSFGFPLSVVAGIVLLMLTVPGTAEAMVDLVEQALTLAATLPMRGRDG